MARQESMAAIENALNPPTVSAAQPAAQQSPHVEHSAAEPHAAPGVEAPAPITTAVQQEPKAQSTKDPAQPAAMPQQQAKQSGSIGKVANSAKKIVRGTGVKLERLPAPGSILLPLIILLVFFFLLLPVNGHTRLVWLWLTLTGNASINSTGTPTTPSDPGPPASSGDTTITYSQGELQSGISQINTGAASISAGTYAQEIV